MSVQDLTRIEEKLDKTVAGAVAISDHIGGVMFTNMAEVMEFAKLMSLSQSAVPKHLRGNPGACLAVTIQSLEWRSSPFAVANKSYEVNDRIAYESQLIVAIINARAPLKERLRYVYDGEGADMKCTVTGLIKGEATPLDYESPQIKNIKVKNSPLWTSDPRQQLGYYSARAWARRHCPETILGIYAEDELERGAETAKDVTPKPDVASRLKGGGKGRGFSPDGVDKALEHKPAAEIPTEPPKEAVPVSEAEILPPEDKQLALAGDAETELESKKRAVEGDDPGLDGSSVHALRWARQAALTFQVFSPTKMCRAWGFRSLVTIWLLSTYAVIPISFSTPASALAAGYRAALWLGWSSIETFNTFTIPYARGVGHQLFCFRETMPVGFCQSKNTHPALMNSGSISQQKSQTSLKPSGEWPKSNIVPANGLIRSTNSSSLPSSTPLRGVRRYSICFWALDSSFAVEKRSNPSVPISSCAAVSSSFERRVSSAWHAVPQWLNWISPYTPAKTTNVAATDPHRPQGEPDAKFSHASPTSKARPNTNSQPQFFDHSPNNSAAAERSSLSAFLTFFVRRSAAKMPPLWTALAFAALLIIALYFLKSGFE